jgi:hypothetical protein
MSEISTYPLRLPRSIRASVERVSKREGVSINQFVSIAVAEKLAMLRDHTVEKLGSPPVAFRAVVGFDADQGDALALLGRLLFPPGMQAVDDEVAGFGGASEGQVQRAGVFVDQTERGVFLMTAHVVVGRLGVATGTAAPRVLADLHRGLAVDAQSRDVSILAAVVFGPEIVEDGIGLRDFFWGLALSTGRSR